MKKTRAINFTYQFAFPAGETIEKASDTFASDLSWTCDPCILGWSLDTQWPSLSSTVRVHKHPPTELLAFSKSSQRATRGCRIAPRHCTQHEVSAVDVINQSANLYVTSWLQQLLGLSSYVAELYRSLNTASWTPHLPAIITGLSSALHPARQIGHAPWGKQGTMEGNGDVDSGSSLERNSWNIHEAQSEGLK